MTPTTEAKANAIRATIQNEWGNDLNIADLAKLLAMLTSPNKDEREHAKRSVRSLIRDGNELLAKEKQATDLAERANHFEP